MSCSSCERTLESEISKIPGVNNVKAYADKGEVIVVMDDGTDIKDIHAAIKRAGYSPGEGRAFIAIALGLLVLLLALYYLFGRSHASSFSLDNNASLAALFLLGILTGFHCVGMCGGFVLSYTLSGKNSLLDHASYGASRLLSYTIIGAIFGLIGSVIAFTTEIRAMVALVAGIFLVLYGIAMLGIFPQLNRLKAKMPSFLGSIFSKTSEKGPIAIGLLNGLMIACGPLQAMYIFAAGTGSAIAGATALFAFGLGTIPAMFALGVLGSAIGTAKLGNMLKYSGVIVVFLGILMIGNGLALSGITLDGIISPTTNSTDVSARNGQLQYQEIYMNVTYGGYEPNSFVLKKGVPVRWVINGIEVSGCNNRIIVPAYGLEIEVHKGMQVVEFTPNKTGTIGWSCWMGMMRGKFIIVE